MENDERLYISELLIAKLETPKDVYEAGEKISFKVTVTLDNGSDGGDLSERIKEDKQGGTSIDVELLYKGQLVTSYHRQLLYCDCPELSEEGTVIEHELIAPDEAGYYSFRARVRANHHEGLPTYDRSPWEQPYRDSRLIKVENK